MIDRKARKGVLASLALHTESSDLIGDLIFQLERLEGRLETAEDTINQLETFYLYQGLKIK